MKKISLLLAVLGLSVTGSALAAKTTKDVSPHAVGERSVYSERATIDRISLGAIEVIRIISVARTAVECLPNHRIQGCLEMDADR